MGSFYWYDLETFGLRPHWDRIAQFAGLRTNENLDPIGEPLVLYCRMPADYLPDPRSSLITGLTPRQTQERGLNEFEFIQKINAEFSRPATCVVGYNSINFDDEFIRRALYRCFFDPYAREYANGNSRWDIIDLVRAARDLRPDGLKWVAKQDGRPGFKLAELCAANHVRQENPHEAFSDVEALIGLARLIKEKQPRLFDWAFKIRLKNNLRPLINLSHPEPLLHVSRLHTSLNGCTAIILPLAIESGKSNSLICLDLGQDPTPLFDLSAEEVRAHLFMAGDPDRRAEGKAIALLRVHLNKAPFLAPLTALGAEQARNLSLDIELSRQRADQVKRQKDLVAKTLEIFDGLPSFAESKDPDLQIYNGFFDDHDLARAAALRESPETFYSRKSAPEFNDQRTPELLKRFYFRNFPERLDKAREKERRDFVAAQILFPPLDEAMDIGKFERKIAALRQKEASDSHNLLILKELSDYGAHIKKTYLR